MLQTSRTVLKAISDGEGLIGSKGECSGAAGSSGVVDDDNYDFHNRAKNKERRKGPKDQSNPNARRMAKKARVEGRGMVGGEEVVNESIVHEEFEAFNEPPAAC